MWAWFGTKEKGWNKELMKRETVNGETDKV
jgi:hypothetical protein